MVSYLCLRACENIKVVNQKVDDLGLVMLGASQTYIGKWIALKASLFGLGNDGNTLGIEGWAKIMPQILRMKFNT